MNVVGAREAIFFFRKSISYKKSKNYMRLIIFSIFEDFNYDSIDRKHNTSLKRMSQLELGAMILFTFIN